MSQKKQSQDVYSTLISSHPHIQNYFKRHVNSHTIQVTLTDLLLQAINQRQKNINVDVQLNGKPQKLQQNQAKKHYQVAYIKQQRFLSPREKQKARENVTPKITEIVPIQDYSKHVIYGKPRIRIQNGGGCPEHGYDCSSPRNTPSNIVRSAQKHQISSQKLQVAGDPQQEITYLKPAYNSPELKANSYDLKIKKNQQEKQIAKNSRNKQLQHISPQTPVKKNSEKRPGKIRNVKSGQNLKNVKSKIKFLVDKDKNERRMAEELSRQNEKIKELQIKQHYLAHHMIKQDEGTFKKKDQGFRNHYRQAQYQHSSSQNSCSSDSSSQIDEELVRKYHKLRNKQEYGKKPISKKMRNCDCEIAHYNDNDASCDQSDSFSCSCSRTLHNLSDSQEDQPNQRFDVKEFLANQRQYTPGYV